jgi:bifunctional DNA-binding transcriptional regulator/antitoxin component of YhaV-PrlF toxin-antitoxin module
MSSPRSMRVSASGRVTIPRHIRDASRLLPNTDVEFVYDGEVVYVVPAAARGMRARRDHGADSILGRYDSCSSIVQ